MTARRLSRKRFGTELSSDLLATLTDVLPVDSGIEYLTGPRHAKVRQTIMSVACQRLVTLQDASMDAMREALREALDIASGSPAGIAGEIAAMVAEQREDDYFYPDDDAENADWPKRSPDTLAQLEALAAAEAAGGPEAATRLADEMRAEMRLAAEARRLKAKMLEEALAAGVEPERVDAFDLDADGTLAAGFRREAETNLAQADRRAVRTASADRWRVEAGRLSAELRQKSPHKYASLRALAAEIAARLAAAGFKVAPGTVRNYLATIPD